MSRLGFIDVALRDGHQCLWATRMRLDVAPRVLVLVANADVEDAVEDVDVVVADAIESREDRRHHRRGHLAEILEEVDHVPEDLGYPILISPFAQFVAPQAVTSAMQGQRYRTIPDEVRKYAMGYYGRLATTPSREFLERAGVEPSVLAAERAGTHIEPRVPRLLCALDPGAADEDVLLAALYDKDLLAPIRGRPPARYRYAATPLAELVAYVRSNPDLARRRVRVGCSELVAEPAEAA